MARLVTITVLVNDTNEKRIEGALEDMMVTAQGPIDPDEDQQAWLVDFTIGLSYPVNPQLTEEIKAENYQGNGITDWVLFSPKEYGADDDRSGFWSNEYGWTTFDLATRFDPHAQNPLVGIPDAQWVRVADVPRVLMGMQVKWTTPMNPESRITRDSSRPD